MNPLILSSFASRLLTVIVFLFIPLSIVAPHGVVWEIIIGGSIGLYYSQKYPLTKLPRPLVYILLAIPLWAMVTVLWAEYPGNSFIMSLKILALIILGLYWCRLTLSLSQDTQKSLVKALIGGLFLGIFFLNLDAWSGNLWRAFWKKSSSKAFAQGSLLISLVVWPAILWILQQPRSLQWRLGSLIGLLFSVFWTLFHIDCDSSFVGLFLGLCIFLGTLFLSRVTSWGMRLFLPLFIISFPFMSLYAFKPESIPAYNSYIHSSSYLDRLYIWNEVATTILEHPWRGIGMNGTHDHKKTQEMREWSYIDKKGKLHKNKTAYFGMHPHNAILQLWLELGFLGAILGVLLTHQVLLHIYGSDLRSLEKAIGAGLFTGAFVIVWVNLGFWQNWWISGLWIIIGLTAMMFRNIKESQ